MVINDAQQKALDYAAENGCVFAGENVTSRGSCFQVAASTLRALERRGFLTVQISPDGGMMGRPTFNGVASSRWSGDLLVIDALKVVRLLGPLPADTSGAGTEAAPEVERKGDF